jgi:hypothetical protein
MYITIREWTTTYVLIDSSTVVTLAYKLVDTKTGQTIWEWEGRAQYSSSQGQSKIIAMAVAAGVHAIGSAASDGKYERDVAVMANVTTFNNANYGLLRGERSTAYAKDQARVKKLIATHDAKRQTRSDQGG